VHKHREAIMRNAMTKEEMALLKEAGEGIHLGIDRRPGSNLRPRDMGYTWIYTSGFLAGAKMASKMWEARGSPQ
jgi:hypothetical protein